MPCQISTNGVSSIPKLELAGNSVDSLHHPWFFSNFWACRHGKCQMLHTADKARRAAEAAVPPIVGRGWVGEDRVGKEGGAELGNGFVASVVAGKGPIDPYEQSCGCVWGLPPPHAREGHEVARGRCRWGRRWRRAPLLVVGGDFSRRHWRVSRQGRWSRCPRGCLRIVGRQRHLVVGGRASGPA